MLVVETISKESAEPVGTLSRTVFVSQVMLAFVAIGRMNFSSQQGNSRVEGSWSHHQQRALLYLLRDHSKAFYYHPIIKMLYQRI